MFAFLSAPAACMRAQACLTESTELRPETGLFPLLTFTLMYYLFPMPHRTATARNADEERGAGVCFNFRPSMKDALAPEGFQVTYSRQERVKTASVMTALVRAACTTVPMRMPALCHGSLSSEIPSSISNSTALIKVDFLFCCIPAGMTVWPVKRPNKYGK